MKERNDTYWQAKLAALMHDSPDKVLRIWDHEVRSRENASIDRLQELDLKEKSSDWQASAADRLPWPESKHCRSQFSATDQAFLHPLGSGKAGARLPLAFEKDFLSLLEAQETTQGSRPYIQEAEIEARGAFFARWRFWRNWASDLDARFAFLPAETRLPDHTIWTHLAVTSAIRGCQLEGDRPAFLLFQLGPVQDYIAAARSTRDLWSGSYLLSTLVARGLAWLSLKLGPDHVLFPNLQGQPLLDYLWREEVWDKVSTHNQGNLGEAFPWENAVFRARLLTPSLPNRFLALVPAGEAEALARGVEAAIRSAWQDIADQVGGRLACLGAGFDPARFDRQVKDFLQTSWVTLPWPEDVRAADALAGNLPRGNGDAPADGGLATVLEMVQKMPNEHRDGRYFQEGSGAKTSDSPHLKQVGVAWGALYAVTDWMLAGVRNTRCFEAWAGATSWSYGREQNKDSLNGKEEALLTVPADEEEAAALGKQLGLQDTNLLQPGELLGASTLIKRLWHRIYLKDREEFRVQDFRMPNTHALGQGQPFANNAEEGGNDPDGSTPLYFAILALDGDEMGKWVSGSKNPAMKAVLSQEAVSYFEQNGLKELLDRPRPLSPSFHLQFSEMLGNYGLYAVRLVVEAHCGRLVYAGGDDVLAMLPAGTALDCAEALRAAFRGDYQGLRNLHWYDADREKLTDTPIFQESPEGILQLHPGLPQPVRQGEKFPLVSDPVSFPMLVPGPAAEVSVGVAIGHAMEPLQDMVRSAQAAEKRAKTKLDRGAVAVTLCKRGGEILEWGTKWDPAPGQGALSFLRALAQATARGELTNRFPHRLGELLEPYLNRSTGAADAGFAQSCEAIVEADLRLTLGRQGQGMKAATRDRLLELFAGYWKGLEGAQGETQARLEDFLGLLTLLAWINRTSENVEPSAEEPREPVLAGHNP